jgi:S1-C subfamily serine protease
MRTSRRRRSKVFDCSSVRCRTAVGLLLIASGFALFLTGQHVLAAGYQFNANVYDEVKPAIVRVSCSDRSATGFLWSGADTAVTAWHVVAGCGNVTVYFEAQRVSRSATVARVLRHADLALLKITDPPAGRVLVAETVAPSLTEPLSVLGYPLQVPSMTNTPLQLRYGGKTLRNIVPESVAQALSGGSPSLDLEIDFIEGHLLPGNSGAPIFNQQRKIVAIADGGLENGAAAVSWGIPAKFLAQLAASNENTNTQQGAGAGARQMHALFAAESEVKNRGEITCSGLTLTKLRTTSFSQLAKSVDSPLGLYQLVQFFQVNPSNFNFDVYQHLPSGATFVVPEGAQLSQDGRGDCVASASTGHIELHLQVGVLGSVAEAQAKSQAFELAWAGGNARGWIADPQWSNWVPYSRFDGLVVQRRAYTHVSDVYPSFMDQYGFETVAIRRNVFIGLSSRYSWTPELSQQLTACRMMPTAPACSEAVRFFANWVKSVLSVQLTTFPVG